MTRRSATSASRPSRSASAAIASPRPCCRTASATSSSTCAASCSRRRSRRSCATSTTSPPRSPVRRAAATSTPAVSNSIILFTGTMTESVRITIEEYGADRLEPGDVIIANDPYRTGTHVNDLLFIRPVFAGRQIVAFVTLKAHQLDMGGSVPGGFSTQKANLYEDGLVLSPRRALQAGKPVQETWTLIFDNAASATCCSRTCRRSARTSTSASGSCSETVERYGPEAVLGAMTYVCDAACRAHAGRRSRSCPTASWEGEDDHRRRRRRRRRGLPRPRAGSRSAAAGPRSTSSGTLPAGAHVASTRRRSTRRRPSGSPSSTSSTRGRVYSSGLHAADRHRPARGHAHQRAAAGRAGVPVLGGSRRRPRGAAACARAGGRASARSAATPASANLHNAGGLHPNGMPWQSGRPVRAASRARGAAPARATPTRSTSPTRPTASRPRSRRPSPTRRS